MNVGPRAQRTLDVAAQVARALAREGIETALVGSVALAVHGFVRATRDVDLAVLVPPVPGLDAIARKPYGGRSSRWR